MKSARQSIADAAMRIFADKGYAGSSIREICLSAGVTKPVLYYHFRSKELLYRELLVDTFSESLKMLMAASQMRGTLKQRLMRIVLNDYKLVKESPERVRFILRMTFAPEEERPYFNLLEEMEKQREVIAGVFQEGLLAGDLQGDPRELATALMGLKLIVILENVLTARPVLTRRSAERQVAMLLSGCARP
jgi:AcrR family transcriptional regulator